MNSAQSVNEIRIDGYVAPVVLRSHRPTDAESLLPIVLYLHGGGFTGGSLEQAEPVVTRLAQTLPAWVISVGYSLAPRASFPVAHEDAYLALAWAQKHARQFKADRHKIAVVGYEAGGNIAAGLAAMARDRKCALSAQVLIAPLLDPSMNYVSTGTTAINVAVSQDIERQYRAYMPRASQRVHPYAAPLGSLRLAGLPPALVAVAGEDLLRGEGEAYAAELTRAGVSAQLVTLDATREVLLNERSPVLSGVNAFLARELRVN